MPPTFDDAWYLEISYRLYHALKEGRLADFCSIYAGAFRLKAPLISVLPLPFYFLFGPSLKSASLVNLAALALLARYVYLLGARTYGRAAGALAVVLVMTFPMLSGLSRRFLVECPLTALVTATAYHLAASQDLRHAASSRALGALLGLGLLLKILFPFYLLGPVADILWRRWRQARAPLAAFARELEPVLKPIFFIALPIALTWYAWNLVYVAGYLFSASFGDIASHYGSTRVFSPGVILEYWGRVLNGAVSPYYAFAGLIALPLAIRHGILPNAGTRLLALWLALPLLVATFGVNKDTRFLTPCLPAFALLLAGALDHLSAGKAWRPAALAAFLAFPVNQYAFHTFHASLLPPLRLGPIHLLSARTNQGGPPLTDGDWDQQGLVDRIQAVVAAPAVVAVGAEHAFLNANNLACFSALRGYPLSFISYGYEELAIERAVLRLADKGATHLLLIDGLPLEELPDNVRKLDPQVRELLAQNRLPFRRVAELAVTDNIRAALYERYAPVRMFGPPPPRRP